MKQKFEGRVETVLIHPQSEDQAPQTQQEVEVTWEGFTGDKYAGLTRPAGSSQKPYPKGAEVRNTRQISIISVEEMEQLAADMGVPHIDPQWVSTNLVLSGIPALSKLPPGTRLHIGEEGVGLVVDEENMPCTKAGGIIQSKFPEKQGLTQAFPKKALGKRGVVAWVERPGHIRTGDTVTAILSINGHQD